MIRFYYYRDVVFIFIYDFINYVYYRYNKLFILVVLVFNLGFCMLIYFVIEFVILVLFCGNNIKVEEWVFNLFI